MGEIMTGPALSALKLAKEATNGWACYAKRQIEHDEISRLHRDIAELEAALSGSVGGLNAAPTALSVETPQEQRANALRGAVFQIWSATGAYSHEIPALCKAAIERDNAVLDALLAPPALAAAEERKTDV